jgi:tetratricopeptide (TPR) repeat protein
VRNALLLRAESALLAGQCLVHAGEYERALTVYEEAMRYPPPPPPVEWGLYGYGYRLDGHTRRDNDDNNDRRDDMGEEEEEEEELNARPIDLTSMPGVSNLYPIWHSSTMVMMNG